MVLFALLMIAMLYVSGYDIYTVILVAQGRGESWGQAFLNYQPFRLIVISLLSTYGIYFLASLIYFEPWHMFTSFSQYTMLLPSYVNILNVYACKNFLLPLILNLIQFCMPFSL